MIVTPTKSKHLVAFPTPFVFYNRLTGNQLHLPSILKNQLVLRSYITMAFLRLRPVTRTSFLSQPTRTFTTTPTISQELKRGPDMGSNKPDASVNSSAKPNADARSGSNTLNTDQQSSASSQEHMSGDDHPAKQPDYQETPSRTTGIGGAEEVKGGKEGQKEISQEGKKNLAGQ